MVASKNLLPHFAAQEQKTKLDKIYALKRIANKRGCIAYIIESRKLIVVSGGKHHEVANIEELNRACVFGQS